jgi:hypothetical protein
VIEINESNLEEVFKYHAPDSSQIPKFEAINLAAKAFAKAVIANIERSPLRTRALNAIMDTRMLANAAIALEKVS